MVRRVSLSVAVLIACYVTLGAQPSTYYPPAGEWARRAPADVGMDAARLTAAITFAQARETNWPRDFSTQEKIFGTMLGSLPTRRPATNGVIIRNGYVVAEF